MMNKIPALQVIDTDAGDFIAEVTNTGYDPVVEVVTITVDEGIAFHSANLTVEGAKALRDWLSEVLKDEQ